MTSTASGFCARRTPLEQKFLAGSQLFALSCRIVMDGIRHQNPDADEQRVYEILLQRLTLLRRLRETR
jgi:hypothetical protein